MGDRRNNDPDRDLQRAYSNYKVYDQHYNEIGKVDDIFVDENDQPEYIGVKMGFLGLKSTVVPMELVRVNDKRGLIEVAESEDVIKNGPSFDDDQVLSPEHESEILNYYGIGRTSRNREEPRGDYAAGGSPGSPVDLEHGERAEPSDRPTHREESSQSYREEPIPAREPEREPIRESEREPDAREPAREPERGSEKEPAFRESTRESKREFEREPAFGESTRESERESAFGESNREPDARETAREPADRESATREPARESSTAREPAREVREEDEVRVQRTEEELQAGVRQREAGSVNVRKRVHTDHEQIRVPKRREEISVERVPVEGQGDSPTTGGSTPGVESSEDEIRIPIVEEEVVVEKKPVVKEEIRIRKNVVEEEEVVQADLRKEEIEVEDETRRPDR